MGGKPCALASMNQTQVRFFERRYGAERGGYVDDLSGARRRVACNAAARRYRRAERTRDAFSCFYGRALREAKQRTDWIDSNESYESVVLNYAQQLFAADNSLFLNDFHTALQPLSVPAW